MTEQEWIEQLKKEGFKNFNVVINEPDTDFGEHTHATQTVHIILDGALALFEKNGTTVVMEAGDRFDIPAGTTHSAKCGSNGCKFIVGEK